MEALARCGHRLKKLLRRFNETLKLVQNGLALGLEL